MRYLHSALLLFFLALAFQSTAQQAQLITSEQLRDKTLKGGAPQSVLNYPTANQQLVQLRIQPRHLFSCFGIGWQSTAPQTDLAQFTLRYRTLNQDNKWSEWKSTEAEYRPEDSPTQLFWTEATFTHDATSHRELEIAVQCPAGVTALAIDLFDGNYTNSEKSNTIPDNQLLSSSTSTTCPAFPSIITRAQWCGGSATCAQVNTAYTPTIITPTHVVIHHGASPDTYTSGQAVVQSYYNYHVNTLGWSDIGYNFLVDKNGNFFQGRHNPNVTTTDVRGAHAGNANSGSIGINFPGNADVTLATTAQLNVVNQLLAWWFNRRSLDPTSSASMITQAYGTQVKPRICGHRDIGQTTCPGNDLYSRLPAMRTTVKQMIDNCACPAPSGLASANITSTSATISWGAIASAASYNIQYRLASATTWTSTTSTTNSLALSGLTAGSLYYFQVQPVCAGVAGTYSAMQSFTTLVLCNAPTGLTATAISSTGATLSWAAVSGAASYVLEYKTSAATVWTSVNTTTTSRILTGLSASTTYNYRVRTTCSNNTSVYSATASFTTLAPPCGTPTALTATAISTTGATLGWAAVSGAVSYTINYRVVGATTWTSTTSTTTSKAIAGLSHTTNYEYRVQTACATNSSAFSAIATFTTTTPPDISVQIGNGTQAYFHPIFRYKLATERKPIRDIPTLRVCPMSAANTSSPQPN